MTTAYDRRAAAPNFGTTSKSYPLGGKLTGPAWVVMWARLADGQWHLAAEVARAGAEVTGMSIKTTGNMLNLAARCGVLERGVSLPGDGYRVSLYRRVIAS